MASKLFRLNWEDFGKSLVVAVLTAVLGFLYQLIKNQGLDISVADLQQMIQVAVLAAISYLSKNLLTNSEGKFGRAEK